MSVVHQDSVPSVRRRERSASRPLHVSSRGMDSSSHFLRLVTGIIISTLLREHSYMEPRQAEPSKCPLRQLWNRQILIGWSERSSRNSLCMYIICIAWIYSCVLCSPLSRSEIRIQITGVLSWLIRRLTDSWISITAFENLDFFWLLSFTRAKGAKNISSKRKENIIQDRNADSAFIYCNSWGFITWVLLPVEDLLS